ncbi:hypothetical protein AURDEDRAFT_168061 [Auricularia subglabra TFB-10046 SS5]|nr:hypothetical protein AURDEDRAFT_168061 [Auricularia subglabra TFB-10046 SS5]
MLSDCVRMVCGVVLPVLLRVPHHARLVSIICEKLALPDADSRRRTDRRSVVTGFFDAMTAGPGALPREFALLLKDFEKKLCLAVSNAAGNLDGIESLATLCARLYPAVLSRHATYGGYMDPRGCHGTQQANAFTVHAFIKRAGLAVWCAAPGGGDRDTVQVRVAAWKAAAPPHKRFEKQYPELSEPEIDALNA